MLLARSCDDNRPVTDNLKQSRAKQKVAVPVARIFDPQESLLSCCHARGGCTSQFRVESRVNLGVEAVVEAGSRGKNRHIIPFQSRIATMRFAMKG
jgi:hypothetical protein